MRKISNLLIIILSAAFLCSCSKEEKTNQTDISLENSSTIYEAEEQGRSKEEAAAEVPSPEETETNNTQEDDSLQRVIDMVLAKQIIEKSDIPVSESDSEYFVPKTEDYMLEWYNYEEKGFQVVLLISFDEEGEICQYIEKKIFEEESKVNELNEEYTIVGNVGYRDDGDLAEHQNINKFYAIRGAFQDIINIDSSTEENIVYWDKEELISSREGIGVNWLSKMDRETVITAMTELYQQGQ